MLKHIRLTIFFLIFCFCFSQILEAAGLDTTFREVTLDELNIGKSYNTKESAGLPLVVVNTGKEPVDLKIEALVPDTLELKPGFEPLPDISWIRIEKAEFKDVKANGRAQTNVFISIPNKGEYKDKRYQAFIWSHTVGRAIGIGLKSKLLLIIKGGENG